MSRTRRRIRVTGTVQGVGFRPFVYRHAVELGLAGFVLNDSAGVLIDVEGEPDRIAELARRLVDGAAAAGAGRLGDRRGRSSRRARRRASGSSRATTAARPTCRSASTARPARTAWPRSTIPPTGATATRSPTAPTAGRGTPSSSSVPYDRPATTMAGFAMCPACQAEYDDPADRRFHAQPNACPDVRSAAGVARPGGRACWPRVRSALAAAVEALRGGADRWPSRASAATTSRSTPPNDGAVAELRRRKARDDKPFAVMVADLDAGDARCARSIPTARGGARLAPPADRAGAAPAGRGRGRRRRPRPAGARPPAAVQPAPPPAPGAASGGRS